MMKIIKAILAIFFILVGMLFFAVSSDTFSRILSVIIIIFAVLLFFTKTRKQRRQKYLEKVNAVEIFQGKHVTGLPIGETPCKISFTKEDVSIEGGGNKYTIKVEKIKYIGVKQDTEIEKEITSSAGKGIAGALLFGTAGAIIGSRTKTKKDKKIILYLIMNYINKENEMTSICFDLGTYYSSNASAAMAQMDLSDRLKNVLPLISQEQVETEL